jgi:phospholipase C
VAYLDPRFLDEGSGSSGDDHPHADIRVGQNFISTIYNAVTSCPAWDKTIFVITYDEWGGFFDHVPPPVAPDTNPAARLRGFRVPCIVISPRARRSYVAHNVYDHTSILKMIEWRYSLAPLTLRDARARNLAEVLDFSRRANLQAPQWDVPPALPLPCGPENPGDYEGWKALADRAIADGWRLA